MRVDARCLVALPLQDLRLAARTNDSPRFGSMLPISRAQTTDPVTARNLRTTLDEAAGDIFRG
jgi:hypothetical protein